MRSIPLLLLALSFPALLAQDVPPPFEDKPPEVVEGGGEDPFDPDQESHQMVHVQVEWIEMPHELLTELLLAHPLKTAAATEMRLELQKLVRAGTAKVLETQMIAARSGEKATVESISEFIFPTEFLETSTTKNEKQGGKLVEVSSEYKARITPTSFETRNLGSTLEVEPTLGDSNRIIDLRFAPDLTWLTGRTVWQETKDERGNLIKVEMPEIYTIRSSSALTLRDGVHALAGIFSPKDDKGRTDTSRKVLLFVKADSLSVR
ncbi:hypothetical protein [Haloferula sp. BvORR071]|uniref:hypothetical protein n=1 Tax=Haloferula sp. BvORR071 TaxID=1396141 RepID=UPI00055731A9|nr:hypothetical protein [Haloferula sp. BvORR071]